MSLYGSNGQINTTSVSGSSYTGLQAVDGSYNIVINNNTVLLGLYHPCGAYNAVVVTDPYAGYYAANGSMNVIANAASPSGYSPVVPAGAVNQTLWTPTVLGSALLAWWDPQSGIAFATGSNVNTWTDRANGIVATNGAATFPVWSATSRNSKPGLSFSGGIAKLLFSAASFPSGSAASTVAISTFQTSNATNSIALSWGSASANAVRAFGKGATNLGLYSDGSTNQPTTELFAATDRFLVASMPGGTSPTNSLYVDGGLAETQAFTTPATTTTNGFIGIWPDGSSFNMIGIIQQIVVFNRVLTSSELAKLAGWESWYDGKAGSNLPIGSPYKTRAPFVSDS